MINQFIQNIFYHYILSEPTLTLKMEPDFFDSKNLYKATGLEKTEVSFRLPSKLGVPPFKTGMTKVEIEKRDDLQAQLSEGFGDFSNSYNISGGKIYSRSECQRMGVALIFWNETGELVLESLK